MTHIINRLQFELTCSGEEQAFRLRHQLGSLLQEQVAEIADVVCSDHVNEDEWLRIDRLEIDLGHFSPASFDDNFATIFKNKFEKELTAKLSGFSPAGKKASLPASKLQVFRYFLQTGTLPWWVAASDVDIDAIAVELLAQQRDAIRQFFYQHLYQKSVWLRAALQLNKQAKAGIVLLITELRDAREIFLVWQKQLAVLLQSEGAIVPDAIADEWIDNTLLQHIPQSFEIMNVTEALLPLFINGATDFFKEPSINIASLVLSNQSLFIRAYEERKQQPVEERATETSIQSKKENKNLSVNDDLFFDNDREEEAIEKYLVKQAGIVLLGPFLTPFFRNLKLLEGIDWKSRDAQYKAVHLLSFLGTGEQKKKEYNLTLEKILCGLPVEEPIPFDIVLEPYEVEECMSLLQSVIEHWKAIKNTSANGLREAFFKRDGLLSQKESDWLLQVERKTIDVLTESIPWSYSTLRFPWNRSLILVEW